MRCEVCRAVAAGLAVLAAAVSLPTRAEDQEPAHQYLVLKDERHFYMNTILGFIPMFGLEAALLRKAGPLIDARLEQLTGGRVVDPDDVHLEVVPGWAEARGLFEQFRLVARHHLKPGDESGFFDDQQPDFAIGPVLGDLEANGQAVDRAVILYFWQVIVDDEKAYDLRPSAETEYWRMDLCVYDLDRGAPLFCAFGGDDELLFDRMNFFREESFVKELDAIFGSPSRRVQFGGDK